MALNSTNPSNNSKPIKSAVSYDFSNAGGSSVNESDSRRKKQK